MLSFSMKKLSLSFRAVTSIIIVKSLLFRTHEGGMLKSMPIFDEYGLKEMMPLKLEEPDDGCLRPSIQN